MREALRCRQERITASTDKAREERITDTVRLATFNVENLFARFKFAKKMTPAKTEQVVKDGWLVDKTSFSINSPKEKEITGEAIKALKADVIALQEVENLDVLKRFRSKYLGGRNAHPHVALIDGNDPRMIDVAVLSKEKFPIVHVRSHQDLWVKAWKYYLFSRDCLEVDIQVAPGKTLTLFVNHFKSMLDKDDPANGRRNTRAKRKRQAEGTREIVEARFGENAGTHDFAVVGDLNDYLETDAQGTTALRPLADWDQIQNVIERLPVDQRWTHYFKGNAHVPEGYHQLDYIFLSNALANKSAALPEIMRRGLAKRAAKYTGPRFDGVGKNSPKASDHCPMVMTLTL